METILNNLTPLGALLWFLCIYLLYVVLQIFRGRKAMRTLEKSFDSAHGLRHIDLELNSQPPNFQKLVKENLSEVKKLGFEEILTGCRLTMNEGGANSYYQFWKDPKAESVLEFSLIKIPRYLSIWPAPLPFPELTGTNDLNIIFETFFTDHSTAVSTTDSTLAETFSSEDFGVPTVRALTLEKNLSIAEMWNSHMSHVRQLQQEHDLQVVLLNSREDVFRKEEVQRKQIAKQQEAFLEKLREESNADLWDPQN